MSILLSAVGALVACLLVNPGMRSFAILVGAMAGAALGELLALRTRLAALEADLRRLTTAAPTPSEAPRPAQAPAAPRAAAPILPPTRLAPSPAPSSPPSWESQLATALRNFLTGGNALVRAGVVVLFFGVAFLLRYMAERTTLPIELRLTGVALSALVLLGLGWRLRTTRLGYALALQGGAVGILYLTTFAALRLYAVVTAALAFPLLTAIAGLSAALAILQDSRSFALLGVTGGFLAPVLASTGEGSHVTLFSYYALLNAGIFLIAWFKAWRPLNIAGFLFTFAIGTAWGVLRYQPQDFASTEPFLALFFMFYLGISILFTLRQPAALTGYVDGTLVFGTPIVVFALQSALLHERRMALAFSAIALSGVYLAAAALLQRRRDAAQRLLIEAFTGLSIAFLTLAIPLALNARWNAGTWGLEGAALVWLGCRQPRLLPRLAGVLLQLGAGVVLATQFDLRAGLPSLSWASYFDVLIQSGSAVWTARTLAVHRSRLRDGEQVLAALAFLWGILWWWLGGLAEIVQHASVFATAAVMAFLALSAVMASEFARRVPLAAARTTALLLLPMMVGCALYTWAMHSHPFANGGWVAWPLTFSLWYRVMYCQEGPARRPLANRLNASSSWVVCAIAGWESATGVERALGDHTAWSAAAWALWPALFLHALPRLVTRIAWPFARNRDAYLFIAGVGVAAYLAAWSLLSNLSSGGDTTPLPYIPLGNPLDLAEALVLLTLFRYWRFLEPVRSDGVARLDGRLPVAALVALGFIELNAVLLRSLHQWFGVRLAFDALLKSTLVQTSLSIFWAILSLVTMLVAARRRRRGAWLAGAGLMGVVVAKLFLVDLSRIGSIERIVSFVGVGLLMLVVGYFSPLPPVAKAEP